MVQVSSLSLEAFKAPICIACEASLPSKPGLTDWYLPANSIFARLRVLMLLHCAKKESCRLRDSHVDWRNGGTKAANGFQRFNCRMLLIAQVDSILNQFIFMLQDDRAQKAVRIQALRGERGTRRLGSLVDMLQWCKFSWRILRLFRR